jgi:hypothetical protein
MFIGAIQMPGISVTLERGMASLYSYLMSLQRSFQRRSGLVEAPLWLPKVRASTMSCFLASSLMSTNGHLLPSVRICFIICHKGCKLKTLLSLSWALNSLPGLSSEFLFASKALCRSNLYLLNITKFCKAALLLSLKLNSGSVGVLQSMLIMCSIIAIKLMGQSNDGCGGLSRKSLSVVGKRWGNLEHSPSN